MLNFFATLGAESQFERNRLILTKPSLQSPNQQAMKSILHTFSGQDEQTRAQIAFACMLKKLHTSNQRSNWIYLLRNLTILDRVMGENRFCQQLSQTRLDTIQNYQQTDGKSCSTNSRYLLKGYWQLIQQTCRHKISSRHILYYKRSERKGFLQTLHTLELFTQVWNIQQVFQSCIALIFITSGVSRRGQSGDKEAAGQPGGRGYREFCLSGLAEYLNLHFYSKLLTLFSCQYLCIHKFIHIVLHAKKNDQIVSVQDAKKFKKMVYKFKKNCQDMVLIAEKNKAKKGFQTIDIRQFNTFSQEHIIKAIDQYICQNSNISILQRHRPIEPLFTAENQHLRLHSQKFVDKKPLLYHRFQRANKKSPRKFIQCQKQYEQQGAFESFFNSYAQQFPHRNMMTIDLIQDIKKDQQKQIGQILGRANRYAQQMKKVHTQITICREVSQKIEQSQNNLMNDPKKQTSKLKLRDILLFGKDLQNQQKQDSTNYSFKNSSQRGSLFDLLNIKWLTQQSEA